jgi:hypothetical protein
MFKLMLSVGLLLGSLAVSVPTARADEVDDLIRSVNQQSPQEQGRVAVLYELTVHWVNPRTGHPFITTDLCTIHWDRGVRQAVRDNDTHLHLRGMLQNGWQIRNRELHILSRTSW